MKKEDIIESAKKNHTIEYDYSLVKDANKMDKIDVICPIHGIFHPRLSRFLLGSNCPLCSGKVKKDKESFVLSAQKKHNNFYSYDKFEYINSHTKSIITCPIHGDFEQSPTNHLNGNGCPKCHKDRLKNIFSSNSEEFITKSKKIHNNFYSYENPCYTEQHAFNSDELLFKENLDKIAPANEKFYSYIIGVSTHSLSAKKYYLHAGGFIFIICNFEFCLGQDFD